MSDYETRPDSGSLFAEQTKKNPKSPDYSGTIAINLKDLTAIKTENGLTVIKLSGWKKVGKNGKTYLSLSVNRYVPATRQGGIRQENQSQQFADDDSNIPF